MSPEETDDIMRRAASLPPVDATEKELSDIQAVRAAALAKLGLESPEDLKSPDMAELFSNDSLLRFSRARKTVRASAEMLVASATWRESVSVAAKVRQWREDVDSGDASAHELLSQWPSGVCGTDKRNCPVYYARYGACDMNNIVQHNGMDRVVACTLSEQREIDEQLAAASVEAGAHQVQVICVADLEGLELGRGRRGLPHFQAMQRILDSNFPERLHVAFVIRAPWIFSALYKLVSPFLAADTKRKVRILSKSDDHLKALSEYIPMEQIPEFLGGGKPCAIPDGHATPPQRLASEEEEVEGLSPRSPAVSLKGPPLTPDKKSPVRGGQIDLLKTEARSSASCYEDCAPVSPAEKSSIPTVTPTPLSASVVSIS
jgi:hypothetical protein